MESDPSPSHPSTRIDRTRRLAGQVSQAIIRAYDEKALLAQVCRTLVEVGAYRMAWIGETAPGETHSIALAHAGIVEPGATAPWLHDPGGKDPTLDAIREQRPQVVRGIASDAADRRRYPQAELLGFAAVCAFPIQFGPQRSGVLAIYAREADAFVPEEVALLRELAGDLAAGVATLRARRASAELEDQLESAQHRYRTLIDQAPIGIIQVSVEGKVILANQALAKLLGYASPGDIVARERPELSQHVSEADLKRIQDMVRTGISYPPLEMPIRRADGGAVWVDVQAQPGVGGGEPFSQVFVRDLTAVRAAQVAGRLLADIVDASEEAVIGIDANGIVLSWSRGATALFGYAESEALRRPLVDFHVPAELRQEWVQVMATLAAGKRVSRHDTRRLCKNGDTKVVSVAASPILDSDGKVVGASTMAHDVGNRHRVESASRALERYQQEVFHLEELTRLRTEFLARAAEELNRPIAPVLLQVQSLKRNPGLDAEQILGLATIERNILRLAGLVKDLLLASSLKSTAFALEPARIDLEELAAEAVASFRDAARNARVLIQTKATGEVPAFADRNRVLQALFNVIDNAIKFTPKGGAVTVEAVERDDGAVVTVSDSGLGFSEAARANLFQPFSRLHEVGSGASVGAGLGLFIAKGIIDEAGGEIWAESGGSNKGTVVGFKLPKPTIRPERPGRGIRAAKGFTGATPGIARSPALSDSAEAPGQPVYLRPDIAGDRRQPDTGR